MIFKKKLIFLICIFFLTACGNSRPSIPASNDMMVFAWKEGSFPGSAYRYLFSTSSQEPGKVYDANSMSLDRYLGWSPEWSPDGEWILTIKENFTQISIINTSSGKERVALEIPRELALYDASWSPDSKKIIYSALGQDKIEMRWIDVSCLQRGEKCKPEEYFLHYGLAPDWSPDGKLIAFAWDPNSNIQGQRKDSIFIMKSDGSGQPENISSSLEDCRNPDWSPDGTRIVFSCKYDIYLSNADGSGQINLTGGLSKDPSEPWLPEDGQPSWDPKGTRIAFLSQRDHLGLYVGDLDKPLSNALYTMDTDGSNIKRITLDNHLAIAWYSWIITPK